MIPPTRTHVIPLLASAILPLLAACSSTEVVDTPDVPLTKGNTITLSLTSPEGTSTRAGDDHRLRYVAKLISGSIKNNKWEFVERKEAIPQDGNNATITFSVEEGSYDIVLFADYIPDSVTTDEDGNIPDYYYNTTRNLNDGTIDLPYMFSVNDDKIGINNDNLDCFAHIFHVEKSAEEIEENIILTRMVSKIRVVSTTPLTAGAGIDNISFSNIPYNSKLDLSPGVKGNKPGAAAPKSMGKIASAKPVGATGSSDATNELFYFYTFANDASSSIATIGEISFAINFTGGTKKEIKIPAGTPAKRNRIITLQGAFYSAPPKELGDIILNLSRPDGWDTDKPNEIKVDW